MGICLQAGCEMQTNDEFIARLPRRDSPYSIDRLSQAETAALEEALLDGYGDVFAFDSKSLPLPAHVTKGLLHHSFFVKSTSECDENEYERKFWADSEGRWGTLRMFPLHFAPTRLRLYFANQLDRFCEYLAREDDGFTSVFERGFVQPSRSMTNPGTNTMHCDSSVD
jgi:hypothetical protein